MKKCKFLLVFSLILVLSLSLAACGNDKDFTPDLSDLPDIPQMDSEELLEDFVPDPFNRIFLKKGEKEEAYHASFVLSNGGECYSTDENVATVSSSGVITGRGKGCAYIFVVESEDSPFANNFGKDPSQRDVAITQVYVGASGAMEFEKTVLDNVPSFVKTFFIIIITIAILGMAGGIFFFIFVYKKAQSQQNDNMNYQMNGNYGGNYGVNPGVNSGVNPGVNDPNFTPPPVQPTGTIFCRNCGERLAPGSGFCPYCGTKL